MNIIESIIGKGPGLDALQMTVRTVIIFFAALLMLRIAGMRTFGKKTAFDNVIIIMLGAVLSRAIIGASPFMSTIVSGFVMVIIHRILAIVSYYNDTVGKIIKGDKIKLYSNGKPENNNMKRTQISHKDLLEEIRLQINDSDFNGIREIFIERTGEISIIKE